MKKIARIDSQEFRCAEFQFLQHYIVESCFDKEICRDRLRMLWTAYCLHQDLDANTPIYDNNLFHLWEMLSEIGDGYSEWEDYYVFDHFMSAYLV